MGGNKNLRLGIMAMTMRSFLADCEKKEKNFPNPCD